MDEVDEVDEVDVLMIPLVVVYVRVTFAGCWPGTSPRVGVEGSCKAIALFDLCARYLEAGHHGSPK